MLNPRREARVTCAETDHVAQAVDLSGASRSGRPRIGMALFGDLTFDSRVRREAATLASEGYTIRLVCLEGAESAPDLPTGVEVLQRRPTATGALPGIANPYLGRAGSRALRLARRLWWPVDYARNLRAWGALAVEAAGPVDAWHVHDFPGLVAIATRVSRDVPIVYDSHEIFLDAGTARQLPGPARTFLRAYERQLVRRVAGVVTVNDSLARVLEHRYRPRRTVVVHNCPSRWAPADAEPGLLRTAAGIPGDAPVVLYHGTVGPDRGIEELLEALLEPGLERVHFVVLGPGERRDVYAALAVGDRFGGRAHILEAVPPDELLSWVAGANVGAVLIQPTTLNHYLSTPNKLFECLAAGVPVVASDFPTMRRVVLGDPAGPLGTVVNPADTAAVAAALRSILDLDPGSEAELRARCRNAAWDRWNWEVESARLVAFYDELLSGPA
jgi:glycosyltransferase involved in cell wall biosynthesis